jgi:predicted signal transduction protein with EAL and GGDEF domain
MQPDEREYKEWIRCRIQGPVPVCTIPAEGGETEQQRADLAAMGCDQIQGCLSSRPLAVAALEALIMAARPQKTPTENNHTAYS